MVNSLYYTGDSSLHRIIGPFIIQNEPSPFRSTAAGFYAQQQSTYLGLIILFISRFQ